MTKYFYKKAKGRQEEKKEWLNDVSRKAIEQAKEATAKRLEVTKETRLLVHNQIAKNILRKLREYEQVKDKD